ncbi:hypothetical protein J6590_023608 [Homalodisca vitripennis]|nr:hypothetical protein J6590_023608 [Homalodisca vitripennis]
MFVYGLLHYLYVHHSATDCFLAVHKCAFGSNSSRWCCNSRSRGECLFTDCYNIYTFTTPPLIASWPYTSVRWVQTVVGGAATHGAEAGGQARCSDLAPAAARKRVTCPLTLSAMQISGLFWAQSRDRPPPTPPVCLHLVCRILTPPPSAQHDADRPR